MTIMTFMIYIESQDFPIQFSSVVSVFSSKTFCSNVLCYTVQTSNKEKQIWKALCDEGVGPFINIAKESEYSPNIVR